MKKKSIFDILEDISEDIDRVKEIAESIREEIPIVAGYLDETYNYLGGAYIAIQTYLEILERGSE